MRTRRISRINKCNDESEKSKLLSEPEAELSGEAAPVLAVHLLSAGGSPVVVVVAIAAISETAAEVKSERTVRLICCTVLG